MLSTADGFMLYGKMGVDFISTSELLYRTLKDRLRLIRARPIYSMLPGNPYNIPGVVDYSLYTRCIALEKEHHKIGKAMLAYIPVEHNYLETLAKMLILLPDKTSLFTETISTMLQFVELSLH